MELNISKKILKEITDYCKVNELDIDEYVNGLVQKFHTANVYGEYPEFIKSKNKFNVLELEKKIVSFEEEIKILKDENEKLKNLILNPQSFVEIPKNVVISDEQPKTSDKGIQVVEINNKKRRILK